MSFLNKLAMLAIKVFRKIIQWWAEKVDTRIEQGGDKRICDKHTTDWISLNKTEMAKYKNEKYTYTNFKNLSKQFGLYPEYYVTDRKYIEEVLPRLSPYNRTATGNAFDTIFNDKNYFERFFPEIKFPKSIVRCINGNYFDENYKAITAEEVNKKLSTYSKVFYKKTLNTYHGVGVKLAMDDEVRNTLKSFGKNFVVQEPIIQHKFLANFNDTSVNVIRIITVFWKGRVYPIDSRLRIGAPGSICDHLGFGGKNPLEIGIKEDGSLYGMAFDDTDGVFLPDIFGKEAKGKIPGYEKMIDLAIKGQMLYSSYGILGWDFTADENGEPVCIEVNSKEPCIKAGQCVGGPIFMKKTVDGNPLLDEIMSEPIRYGSMPLL